MNRLVIMATATCLLVGCGGGSAPAEEATGIVNVAISDAAVDTVTEVIVQFTGVTLKPEGGSEIVADFDMPKSINLLELQGGRTEALLADNRVPVGRYNWIRLAVNAEFDNVMDSYVITDAGESIELRVPSGGQSGLKLVSGFTVTQNQSTNLVIDWDLRKALSNPSGQPGMQLRPALRITDMAAYGTLQGSVAEALTMADNCGDEPGIGNAVYVYEGSVDTPADIRTADTDPVVTATVAEDLSYSINYLSAGEYTAAFTCQAELDNPEEENDLVFSAEVTEVTITAGETSIVNFEASIL